MNHTSEANMKKISVANLDKLLDDFSQIEKAHKHSAGVSDPLVDVIILMAVMYYDGDQVAKAVHLVDVYTNHD
ncbi:unnamed protein product [Caretta caretta]